MTMAFAEYKFREIGVFQSEKHARAFAMRMQDKGKKIRVERHDFGHMPGQPIQGWGYSVREWRARELMGRHFKIDTRRP